MAITGEMIRKAVEVGARLEIKTSTRKRGIKARLVFRRKDFDAEQWAAICDAFLPQSDARGS